MAPFSLRLLPCSAAEHRTAIHVEDFASNVARPIRAQEHDGVGDVVRQRDTLQRNRLLDFVLVSVGAGAKDGIIFNSVSTQPGATQFTRMLGANSMASDFAKLICPPFDAA